MLKQQKQKVGEEEEDYSSRAYFNFEHSLNNPYKKYLSAILVFYEINNIILRKKKIEVLMWRRARNAKTDIYYRREKEDCTPDRWIWLILLNFSSSYMSSVWVTATYQANYDACTYKQNNVCLLFSYVTSAVVTFSLFFSVLIFSASPGLLVSWSLL